METGVRTSNPTHIETKGKRKKKTWCVCASCDGVVWCEVSETATRTLSYDLPARTLDCTDDGVSEGWWTPTCELRLIE